MEWYDIYNTYLYWKLYCNEKQKFEYFSHTLVILQTILIFKSNLVVPELYFNKNTEY